jgi:hypothetical protein
VKGLARNFEGKVEKASKAWDRAKQAREAARKAYLKAGNFAAAARVSGYRIGSAPSRTPEGVAVAEEVRKRKARGYIKKAGFR